MVSLGKGHTTVFICSGSQKSRCHRARTLSEQTGQPEQREHFSEGRVWTDSGSATQHGGSVCPTEE